MRGHAGQALASSSSRSATIVPFQPMVPSKSTSMRTISGGLGGGALGAIGMFILTAWVWIGMVMMNMISSTSITSISGVMFMSIIGSSSPPPEPTFMAMVVFLQRVTAPAGGSVMKPTLTMPARWQATTTRPTLS